MTTGGVSPGAAPTCAEVGYQPLQLGAQAEVVGIVLSNSYEQLHGVEVQLVPPGLVGGGEEQLDSVGAALRERPIKAVSVPAFRLSVLPGQV